MSGAGGALPPKEVENEEETSSEQQTLQLPRIPTAPRIIIKKAETQDEFLKNGSLLLQSPSLISKPNKQRFQTEERSRFLLVVPEQEEQTDRLAGYTLQPLQVTGSMAREKLNTSHDRNSNLKGTRDGTGLDIDWLC